MLGFHIAAVYINGIAHRLECIKADAERQSQAQEGNGRSYYGVDVVDEKVGVFEKEQHAKALDILRNNKTRLHEIAAHLLEKETITGEEFMEIFNRVQEA